MNTEMPQATPGTMRSKLHPILQELIHLLNVQFVEPKYFPNATNGASMPYGCGGVYEFRYDVVSVRDDFGAIKGKQDYYLMHELVHWTGHKSRLSRPVVVNGVHSAEQLDTEEATAEYGMFKLAVKLGFDEAKAFQYLEKYLSNHPYALLDKAEADAEVAVAYILAKAYGYAANAA